MFIETRYVLGIVLRKLYISSQSVGFFFLEILFIYLMENEQESTRTEGEREAGSSLSREPDVGLDPRTLRS